MIRLKVGLIVIFFEKQFRGGDFEVVVCFNCKEYIRNV